MRIIRPMLIAVAALTVLTAGTGSAFAATAHPASAGAEAQRTAVHSATVIGNDVPAAGKPTQCPGGDFCIYSGSNGSDICSTWSPGQGTNSNNWYCYDNGTVFDNGSEPIAMNYLANLKGAWTCIGAGSYWLFTDQYVYDHGSTSGPGWNAKVSSGIGSYHFQSNNCGNTHI